MDAELAKHLTDIMQLVQRLSGIIDTQQLEINQLKETIIELEKLAAFQDGHITKNTLMINSVMNFIHEKILGKTNENSNK